MRILFLLFPPPRLTSKYIYMYYVLYVVFLPTPPKNSPVDCYFLRTKQDPIFHTVFLENGGGEGKKRVCYFYTHMHKALWRLKKKNKINIYRRLWLPRISLFSCLSFSMLYAWFKFVSTWFFTLFISTGSLVPRLAPVYFNASSISASSNHINLSSFRLLVTSNSFSLP